MSKFLLPLRLQHFAEDSIDPTEDVTPEEDVIEEEDNLITEEDEEPEEDESEDTLPEEDEVEEEEDLEDVDDSAKETNKPVAFDKKQQKELDRIIKTRLERQEGKFLKDLRDVAGTEIQTKEVSDAARLWGLLKTNPDLSRAVGQLIDQQLQEGKAKAPETKDPSVSSKEAQLEMKEAVLDLKLADKTFNKHSDKILKWAEDQGFEVTNKKSLKLAFMAWKGSQDKIISTTKKVSEQKKQAAKEVIKQKAKVQSGKPGKSKGNVDYTKLSDSDVLSSMGINLFTDD